MIFLITTTILLITFGITELFWHGRPYSDVE
jgi:hypothetical protein